VLSLEYLWASFGGSRGREGRDFGFFVAMVCVYAYVCVTGMGMSLSCNCTPDRNPKTKGVNKLFQRELGYKSH